MAGLKRALFCKASLPTSCFLSLPVQRPLLLCLALVDLLKRMLPGSFALAYREFRLEYREFGLGYGELRLEYGELRLGYGELRLGHGELRLEHGELRLEPFWPGIAAFGPKMPVLTLLHMKTAYWDATLSFDDPNLRWGNPSYLLEPGDPGYVPPVPSVNQPIKKGKRMKHSKYFPRGHDAQIVWLANFMGKLSGYATALGLTTAQVTAAMADCGWLIYILELWLPAVRAYEKACTSASATAQTGAGSGAMRLPTFTAPTLPTGVTAQAPGALNRIFALVQTIKNSGKCTDAIGEDLRVIGSAASGPDLNTVVPIITAKVSGGAVHIGWGYDGNRAWLEGCEIQVDRGDGHGYGLLTIDTTPNYVDTHEFPAGKAVWSYKAIYRADDTQVGQWSKVVSVAVGG